jgi:predicted Zn finger-like uncharacterized protein
MNVTCTGCPAKYSVPDDKVRGKKVRITCKHCGTNIVVDGSALGASQSVLPQVGPEVDKPAVAAAVAATPSASAKAAPTPEAAAPVATKAPAVESTWLVGFIDDRQEQHSTSEVVALYASAKIDDETLVWKDGMDDWLPPFDVPEIAAMLKQRGVARRAPSFALPGASDDEPTVVGRSPFEEETVVSSIAPAQAEKSAPAKSPAAPAVAAMRQSTPEIKPSAAAIRQSAPEIKPTAAAAIRQSAPEIKPAAVPVAAKPSAARRTEKRAEVDLFGGVANAGSEADTSLDFGAAEEPAHKMTGARNESSVLFSLDALTKPDPKAGQKKAQEREKEKQATADLFGDAAPNSLMNMGGGGLAALAAPDFTKPAAPEPAPVRPSDPVEVPNAAPAKKGSALVIAAVVGIAAAAGLAFMFMSKKPPADKPADSASTDAKAAAAPTTPVATATEAAPASAPAAASAEPATSAAAPAASGGAAVVATKPAAAGAAAPASAAVGAAAPVNKPADKPADTKKPDSPPAAPAAGADFDKSAAIAALGAAAANAASCKKPDGPTGGGKASVTFAPSGRATNSTVTGAFAGTDVGGCVARIFRSARVPAFAGDPVTVSKSFSIE